MDFMSTINSIEKTAAANIKAEQGDYIIDGLLYCGNCKTAKQCRITILGEERTPYCLCKCEVARRAAEEEERKRKEFADKIRSLRKMGFPDADMQNWTFAADDKANPRISTAMQKYVEHFDDMLRDGKGLLLYGTVGTGKTFAAACAVNALIDKGYPCLITNFARLTNTISGMYEGKQAYIDGLNKFALLVIDDLAAERNTEYMGEIVQNIIDARYRAGLPIIITTNLTKGELQNSTDLRKQRIYSRLFDMCIPVEVFGADRRREKLNSDYKKYADILGI